MSGAAGECDSVYSFNSCVVAAKYDIAWHHAFLELGICKGSQKGVLTLETSNLALRGRDAVRPLGPCVGRYDERVDRLVRPSQLHHVQTLSESLLIEKLLQIEVTVCRQNTSLEIKQPWKAGILVGA